MTKNEALKEVIDGKKVRNTNWSQPNLDRIWFNGKQFMFGHEGCELLLDCASDYDTGWEIVPEYVDFAMAWKAYQKEKVIQSVQTGNKKNKSCGILQKFDEFEISGKWLILEDNS